MSDTTPATMTIAIFVPLPDRALCGNGRAHGFALTRLRKQQREDAALCAYAALAELTAGRGPLYALTRPAFPTGRVVVTAWVHRDPRWAARALDSDNLWRGLKSTLDGFADAGIVTNDRQFELSGVIWQRAEVGQGGVTLTLTQEVG